MAERYVARIFREKIESDGTIVLSPVTTARSVTVQHAASVLGVSAATLYRRIQEGNFPARRPTPKCVRVDVEDLVKYCNDCRDPEFVPAKTGER